MKDLLLMRAPLKYIQGEGALEHFYENCKSFGKKYLFVCSHSGYEQTIETLWRKHWKSCFSCAAFSEERYIL